jgi:hypothetical protein
MVMVWFPAYPVMGTASFAGKTKKPGHAAERAPPGWMEVSSM